MLRSHSQACKGVTQVGFVISSMFPRPAWPAILTWI